MFECIQLSAWNLEFQVTEKTVRENLQSDLASPLSSAPSVSVLSLFNQTWLTCVDGKWSS